MTALPEFPELDFNERKHIYTLRGVEIPSVSKLMEPLSNDVYGSIAPDVLQKAAARGTIVHNAIENYLNFGITDITAEYGGYFDAFIDWHKQMDPIVLATEARVYHKQLGYAGTSDLICEINGVMTLVDYKTSYQVNPMLHGIQLEGYARAWQSHGVDIKDRIILHLKRDGQFEVYHYPRSSERYSVLVSLITIHSYKKISGGM